MQEPDFCLHTHTTEVGTRPVASAAPSAGDFAAHEAQKMEKMAKDAVGGLLFNSNMFKTLEPFPEPPIDPP